MIRMPTGCLPMVVYLAHPTGSRPGTGWRDHDRPGGALKALLGRGVSGMPGLACFHLDLTWNKQKERMGGWRFIPRNSFPWLLGYIY